ncbi:MAG: DUF2301 domain-containing membrane protein [Chroococcidiopsidaceae cyanobacterium CP_BM_ER_R8_30]|nr:DUF2301 domain-containing membrane protein [Chroococcidiopsidaceae cyanobacterium CP_BM_ER_R8_30]
MTQAQPSEPVIYQGQFGEFTITQSDRSGVIIYRAGLLLAAISFAIGSFGVLLDNHQFIWQALTPLYACFCLALGISLLTIHIYLAVLHRLLQTFWAIGCVIAVALALSSHEPLALFIYNHPAALFGVGFTFAALTGIYFKEAFCFNRLETKLLTPLVPVLLLGHLLGVLPVQWERAMLATWAALFVTFALRKVIQPIPPDIGDKSVFAYLQEQRSVKV